MNPEVKAEYTQPTSPDLAEAEKVANTELDVNVDEGTLAKLPPAETTTNQQWQQFNQQLYPLIERLSEVFKEYKGPVTITGIVLATLPFVVLVVSILQVIDTIPLLSSTFELVGFGFTAWFVYRYLLFVERRQEFSRQFQNLKERILGDSSPSA